MNRSRWALALVFAASLCGCSRGLVVRDGLSGDTWFVNGVQSAGAAPDQDGADANRVSLDVAQYYRSILAQNEIDRIGGAVVTVNSSDPTCRNAGRNASGGLGDGNVAVANVCDNSVSLDLGAHEGGHALVELLVTRDLYPYQGETGAIEEGLVDLFGEQAERFIIGNPADGVHPTAARAADPACAAPIACGAGDVCEPVRGLCLNGGILNDTAMVGVPFRSVATPGGPPNACINNACTLPAGCLCPRPERYLEPNRWRAIAPPCTGGAGGNDFCGVHTNSGVFNRATWLLVQGGTYRGVTVRAVTSPERAFLSMLRVGTLFPVMAASYDTLALFVPLFVPTQDRQAYVDAFCSVGLPSTASECQDPDNDGLVSRADNCPNRPNPDQFDDDSDGAGNVCDTDRDDDGVPDASDNCVSAPNVLQENLDGDTLGDACDPDDDNDGVNDARDNCPRVVNPDQRDLDNDGQGDACDADRDGDCIPDMADHCDDVAVCSPPPPALCQSCVFDITRITLAINRLVTQCGQRLTQVCPRDECGGPLGDAIGIIERMPGAGLDRIGLVRTPSGGIRVVRPGGGAVRSGPLRLGGQPGFDACAGFEAEIIAAGAQMRGAEQRCTAARQEAERVCNPTTCGGE